MASLINIKYKGNKKMDDPLLDDSVFSSGSDQLDSSIFQFSPYQKLVSENYTPSYFQTMINDESPNRLTFEDWIDDESYFDLSKTLMFSQNSFQSENEVLFLEKDESWDSNSLQEGRNLFEKSSQSMSQFWQKKSKSRKPLKKENNRETKREDDVNSSKKETSKNILETFKKLIEDYDDNLKKFFIGKKTNIPTFSELFKTAELHQTLQKMFKERYLPRSLLLSRTRQQCKIFYLNKIRYFKSCFDKQQLNLIS